MCHLSSARHTLVAVLFLVGCGGAAKLPQRRLQAGNALLEVFNLLLLVLARPVDIRQGQDSAPGLLDLQAHVVGGCRDMLDVERPVRG